MGCTVGNLVGGRGKKKRKRVGCRCPGARSMPDGNRQNKRRKKKKKKKGAGLGRRYPGARSKLTVLVHCRLHFPWWFGRGLGGSQSFQGHPMWKIEDYKTLHYAVRRHRKKIIKQETGQYVEHLGSPSHSPAGSPGNPKPTVRIQARGYNGQRRPSVDRSTFSPVVRHR